MKSVLILICALLFSPLSAHAQTVKLLKDVNNTLQPSPSSPRSSNGPNSPFLHFKGGVLLSAWTLDTGAELWFSDGTQSGTRLVKDLWPGKLSGLRPFRCVSNDGKLAFFSAADPKHGEELWVTDGTTAGTRLVKDIATGTVGSSPSYLVAFGASSVLFVAKTAATGSELYISDGTISGTRLIKDVNPGTSSGFFNIINPIQVSQDGKRAWLAAGKPFQGSELWTTDGTTKGTVLVKDINPGASSSNPEHMTQLGAKTIVFTADDGTHGRELWISDGTSAGTSLVVDLKPGRASGIAKYPFLIALGSNVLFGGNSGSSGEEAHVTDGTAKGTFRLIDAMPGAASGSFLFPRRGSHGKMVYWTASKSVNDVRIFVSDGTVSGTRMFTQRSIGLYGAAPVEVGGKVYFEADNLTPGTGQELCVSDGTLAGTKTLRDTLPGKKSGMALSLTRMSNSELLYSSDDGLHGMELWKMTKGKTFQLIDINQPKLGPSYSSYPKAIVRFGKYVLFTADDSRSGHELWISDGTDAGTHLLKDLYPGMGSSLALSFASAGDKLVFEAFTPATGRELFVTDGTSAGTRLLKDIRPGSTSSFPKGLASVGDKVFFSCSDGIHGTEPWISDGTTAGTRLLKDVALGSASSFANNFAGRGGKVVFSAYSMLTGAELYISDGTSAGTRLLKDINPGIASSNPSYLVFNAGKVVFSAFTNDKGIELWTTDFTSRGTVLLKDILPGTGSSAPLQLSARSGRVFFGAYTPKTGDELFVSDGTTVGTRLFLDLQRGSWNGLPRFITAVGSRKVYFGTGTPTLKLGWETSISDGKTTKVLDLYPGSWSGDGFFTTPPDYRVTLGNLVCTRVIDPFYGEEVFTIDNGATVEPLGTPSGSTWIQGSDPVLGKTAVIEGQTSLANPVHLTVMGTLAARPIPFGNYGFLHFDIAGFFRAAAPVVGSKIRLDIPIPNSSLLDNFQLVFQTLAFDATNLTGSLELSNGLHWTLGR